MTRAAGIPNKNKRGLRAELKKQYGKEFDVIMMMAENCNTLHKVAKAHQPEGAVTIGDAGLIDATTSAKTAIDALEKLAQYVEPKLKAVEVTGEGGEPLSVTVISYANSDT
ncbi:MAG: hypothetical protein ACN2B6_00020 [Rickettsiales bacterium]